MGAPRESKEAAKAEKPVKMQTKADEKETLPQQTAITDNLTACMKHVNNNPLSQEALLKLKKSISLYKNSTNPDKTLLLDVINKMAELLEIKIQHSPPLDRNLLVYINYAIQFLQEIKDINSLEPLKDKPFIFDLVNAIISALDQQILNAIRSEDEDLYSCMDYAIECANAIKKINFFPQNEVLILDLLCRIEEIKIQLKLEQANFSGPLKSIIEKINKKQYSEVEAQFKNFLDQNKDARGLKKIALLKCLDNFGADLMQIGSDAIYGPKTLDNIPGLKNFLSPHYLDKCLNDYDATFRVIDYATSSLLANIPGLANTPDVKKFSPAYKFLLPVYLEKNLITLKVNRTGLLLSVIEIFSKAILFFEIIPSSLRTKKIDIHITLFKCHLINTMRYLAQEFVKNQDYLAAKYVLTLLPLGYLNSRDQRSLLKLGKILDAAKDYPSDTKHEVKVDVKHANTIQSVLNNALLFFKDAKETPKNTAPNSTPQPSPSGGCCIL